VQVTEIINVFLKILRSVSPDLALLNEYDRNDWLEANWEILVEGPVGQAVKSLVYLEIYGDGADANDPNSRILYPEAQPTHRIVARLVAGSTVQDQLSKQMIEEPTAGFPVDRFVSMGDDGWFYERLPFDMFLSEVSAQEITIPVDKVAFWVEPM